jgi:hypothetical protein
MEWIDVISNIGVPIGCMAALAGYVLKRDKRDEEKDHAHAETINSIMSEHKAEIAELRAENTARMEKLTEAVNNNTIVMTKLCERLGQGE